MRVKVILDLGNSRWLNNLTTRPDWFNNTSGAFDRFTRLSVVRGRYNVQITIQLRTLNCGLDFGLQLSGLVFCTNDCCREFLKPSREVCRRYSYSEPAEQCWNVSWSCFVLFFLNWCKEAFLKLIVTNTKDMCIDFRHHHPTPANTNGQDVVIVESYK